MHKQINYNHYILIIHQKILHKILLKENNNYNNKITMKLKK